jgi:hypothetical protein
MPIETPRHRDQPRRYVLASLARRLAATAFPRLRLSARRRLATQDEVHQRLLGSAFELLRLLWRLPPGVGGQEQQMLVALTTDPTVAVVRRLEQDLALMRDAKPTQIRPQAPKERFRQAALARAVVADHHADPRRQVEKIPIPESLESTEYKVA